MVTPGRYAKAAFPRMVNALGWTRTGQADANALYQELQAAQRAGRPQAEIEAIMVRLRDASRRTGLSAPAAPAGGLVSTAQRSEQLALLAQARRVLERLQGPDPGGLDLAYILQRELYEAGFRTESQQLREAADRLRLARLDPARRAAPVPTLPPPQGTVLSRLPAHSAQRVAAMLDINARPNPDDLLRYADYLEPLGFGGEVRQLRERARVLRELASSSTGGWGTGQLQDFGAYERFFLSPPLPTTPVPPAPPVVLYVVEVASLTGDGLHVRSGPGVMYPVLDAALNGTRLQVLEHNIPEEGGVPGSVARWSQILLPDGSAAFVQHVSDDGVVHLRTLLPVPPAAG